MKIENQFWILPFNHRYIRNTVKLRQCPHSFIPPTEYKSMHLLVLLKSESMLSENLVVFFTIIQLNRSILYDIEHFISQGNSFMVHTCMHTYIYIYVCVYVYICRVCL